MKLRLFTLVYGPYIDLMEQGLLRSLKWPKNLAAIKKAECWDVYTNNEDRERITALLEPFGIPINFTGITRDEIVSFQLNNALIAECEVCVKDWSTLFPLQPDLLFGEGSIGRLLKLAGEGKNLCIAMPHPRVETTSFLADMPEGVIENDQLVHLAMGNLHWSWRESNMECSMTNTFHGGAMWRYVGDGLYAVTCRVPTCFVANPVESDITFLKKCGRGAWDHRWPTILMEENRHRLVASSDVAFVVELTSRNKNPPHLNKKDSAEPDKYRFDFLHHRVNRNTICVWRSKCG